MTDDDEKRERQSFTLLPPEKRDDGFSRSPGVLINIAVRRGRRQAAKRKEMGRPGKERGGGRWKCGEDRPKNKSPDEARNKKWPAQFEMKWQ